MRSPTLEESLKMIKPILASALLLASITSCSDDQNTQTPPTVSATPSDTISTGEDPCRKSNSGYAYLPGGVVFRFKHHLRNDRFVQGKAGDVRRRVALELLDGSAGTISRQIEQSMTAAGYNLAGTEASHGKTVMRFRKKGRPLTQISILPSAGANPVSPDAIGLIIVDFKP